jgi:hypothetical protein
MHTHETHDGKRLDWIENFTAGDSGMTAMTLERVHCVARACDGIIGLYCHFCHGPWLGHLLRGRYAPQ